MSAPPSRLLLAAALLALPVSAGAVRRSTERAPVRGLGVVAQAPPIAEMARHLEAQRIAREYGEDWNEALVETVDGDIEVVLRRHGGSWRARGMGKDAVKAPGGRRPIDWYLEVWADPSVRRIEPNPRMLHPGCRQMSVDILESGTQLLPDLALQVALAQSSAEALDATTVTVAVIDSGVAPLPGLVPQLEPAIDALHPLGPALMDDPLDIADHAGDVNGHGTAMASLVASLATGARIRPIRVVGADCEGTAFDLATGLVAAADLGCQVALVSLSTTHDSPFLRRTIEEVTARGMLVVAAAGNAGQVEYPAAHPGVLAVTAVDRDGWPPSFAPLGARVDVAAPGVNVVALGPDSALSLTGTSPAAAIVAAAAARAAHVLPGTGPHEWTSVIGWAARPASEISPALEGRIGAGILDFEALK